MLLIVAATGVAAAAPRSPLRRLIAQWLTTSRRAAPSRPSAPPRGATPAATQAPAASGISLTVAKAATINFAWAPDEGELRIRLVEGAAVSITGSSVDTRFAVTGHGVTVMPGRIGSFDVEIPRALPHASIRVAGRVVFSKAGADVTSGGQLDSSGTTRIRFTSQQRSTP